ncbi:VOC family protein [Paenibacillus senegalensis]|uniref:VOC family protein n=1 Tax=Paenibacillus senegalensis TaxID=1465766 RepID=UPI000289C09C|nr:VOC family protein [Paenibacillus senegalensis]
MSMRATPLIMLDGKAAEAVEFYEKAFNSEVLFKRTFGEGKDAGILPEEAKPRIAHSVLRIGENDIMVADIFPGEPHSLGDQVTICITATEHNAVEEMYSRLKEDGGQIIFPLQETEFSPCYGVVKDRYNVTFHLFKNDTTRSWSGK